MFVPRFRHINTVWSQLIIIICFNGFNFFICVFTYIMALYVCRIKVALMQNDNCASDTLPASVVHIGSRHKISHCCMMFCKSTVVQY